MEKNKPQSDLTLVEYFWDQEKTKIWHRFYIDKYNRGQGLSISWYENGKICAILEYKDDKKAGIRKVWNSDGTRQLIDTSHLKKGYHGADIEFNYKLYENK